MMRLLLAALAIAGALAACWGGSGYTLYLVGLIGLTTLVGIGLNLLLGLTGEVSLGQVGFYAIGAYVVAILTTDPLALSFWLALPAAAAVSAAIGFLLALPALRVRGPYLAMVTIAFGFIIENGAIEWRTLTGGANGLMNIPPPLAFGHGFAERDVAALAVVLTALGLWLFARLAASPWGLAMRAVKDAEIAAQSIGLAPVVIRTVAFVLAALVSGVAGGLFATLTSFVSPSAFPFSQSILFLLVVIIGGAGSVLGPLAGALVVVLLPELLSSLAEYRLLMFGALLLVVLWIAPEGIVGALARLVRRPAHETVAGASDAAAYLAQPPGGGLEAKNLAIAFGGVRAVSDVDFSAKPGAITSLIGPNGAGKTTLLNLIGGFYKPEAGTIALDGADLTGAPAFRLSRAGIARTYQTTQLFGSLSVLDNVVLGLQRGRLGAGSLLQAGDPALRAQAAGLLAFVGYVGDVGRRAADLPHGDKRLVEIARALATRPKLLLLDEPAAGLNHADTAALGTLLRAVAATGIAVVLVEHDMALVMSVSDHVVVLDTGRRIAAGAPATVQRDPAVRRAYLGDAGLQARPRAAPLAAAESVLSVERLGAGYGGIGVLDDVAVAVGRGELVAVLGANGAGKSTLMRALSGLLRPVTGSITLLGGSLEALPAHAIARRGLALVPEGRQVFPHLSVLDNLRLGANRRRDYDEARELPAILQRFPALQARLHGPAGLLSGGEQQMLAVARGLLAKPDILLLDEPSLGLAPALINTLFDIVAQLRDDGTTLLLVDQMAALALAVADRGYVLDGGRIVHQGRAADLAQDGALEQAYLGASAD
ncbi:MAG: ATP-binding cassette domain-containing protein [Alphaproteobacteria bacterium]|nr:ATP-binding cassette domain-containing protein [Alphaproteobacteria bacterium]